LRGIRRTHEVHPQIEPAFLLAQPGHFPPGLAKPNSARTGTRRGKPNSSDTTRDTTAEAEPEVQPHATVHPGKRQQDCLLWVPRSGAELPNKQDQTRV